MPTTSARYTPEQNARLINELWPRLVELCATSPNGIYRASWEQMMKDTGGWNPNSLAHWCASGELKVKVIDCGVAYDVQITSHNEAIWE